MLFLTDPAFERLTGSRQIRRASAVAQVQKLDSGIDLQSRVQHVMGLEPRFKWTDLQTRQTTHCPGSINAQNSNEKGKG